METIALDQELTVEITYLGMEDELHVWDFKFIDNGDTILVPVKYKTDSPDARTSLDILLNDTGSVDVDLTKVHWWYTSVLDAFK
jgi:hypothetical protein